MVNLDTHLELDHCPHCSVAKPLLGSVFITATHNHSGHDGRYWKVFKCTNCGGLVSAYSMTEGGLVEEVFPESKRLSPDIPEPANSYLKDAIASLHAPTASILVAASSVDAMLKAKNYLNGTLYSRIKEAAKDNILTKEMTEWAHDIRLDANDERHADEDAGLPKTTDAERVIKFATALAEYLFVLPAKTRRKREV